jgi:alpha-L-arabinofuranosidase
MTTAQSASVKVTVSGSSGIPTGSVALSSGSYTSSATALSGGSATITVAAGVLAVGTDTLSATYAPDVAGSSNYTGASGTGSVTVTKAAPTVTVTPASASITPGSSLAVAIAVSGGSGTPVASGSVTLTSGAYTSASMTLASGGATITVPAGSLAAGSDTLSATYTPDTNGSAIYNSASGNAAVTVGMVTPTVTVTPASASIDTQTAVNVTIAVNGGTANPTATGSVMLAGGAYTSAAAALASGSATISIPAATLAAGSVTLTGSYTPDAASTANFASASGSASLTVTKITPTVTVTPASTSLNSGQDLKATVTVTAASGDATPTGSVVLASGAYTSAATALASGSLTIDIPAGSLANGSDTLTAAYTPDTASAPIFATANGASAAITVVQLSTVTVNQGVSGPAITDQLLGMNLGDWNDPTDPAIVPAFKAAGIKAIRWPGGSWSDDYHWQTNSMCSRATVSSPLEPGGWADPNGVYANIINDLEIAGGIDVALTANYGTDSTCTKGGDPTEAAAWIKYAEQHGGKVGHITVGNEEYGTWEDDLHAKPNDPTTYANAAATGYYPDIKAVDKNVLVGVVANPGNVPDWDTIVLANAKYDFVEFHFYAQGPFQESDTYITQQAAQDLTAQIEALKAELKTAGKPDTPIYVGEIGSVYTNPGKQSWSITQGLYAGQALGEMMNEGISRLTWWIGFGNCNGQSGNDSATLYGWQNFGAYNVFSDGANDPACPNAGPDGTMSPTAQAFNLFQQVAVNGESVLTAAVGSDNTDVRAYAATHSGGTALVLFNLNETASLPVNITLSAQAQSSDVKVTTYSKAIYDQSKTDVWSPPTTTDMGAKNLPLTLKLAPWSMNVVIIK